MRPLRTIRAYLAAELLVEGERLPVFVWTIDHPAGLVLVDTGMIDSRPEIDDMSPTSHPENITRDVACVINTHLHFDHVSGNRLFPGVPIHVQASSPTRVRSPTTRSENGSTSTARGRSSTRARWSCYRESACCRRPGIGVGIKWSSSRPVPA
jgi:glyoxylase-like metal-dependent hydrolase (beta-lactamase superfamily II)